MTEIFTAKTVEEAKMMAVKKFGKKADQIKFEVIDAGKKGFLGIGQTDAKVKATYIAPVPKPVAAPAKAEAVAEKAVEEVAAPVEAVAEKAAEEVAAPVEAPAEIAAEKTEEVSEAPAKKDDEDFSIDDYTLIEDEAEMNPKVKIAVDYITSILNAMDIKAEFTVYQNESGAVINVESGENNGTIIGRRGETLDSIQYLCSIIANKGDKDYFRLTIDCLGYRSKRKETLQQLAAKVAKSVLRTGRLQRLEPMNPYERRVIHSAVSEIEGVSSRSEGEEPYRKIVIYSTNPRNNKHRNSRRDDRRNNRSKAPRDNYEPKAIDLSTSFEKDYKKPKPEDSMDGGLYGKIEF